MVLRQGTIRAAADPLFVGLANVATGTWGVLPPEAPVGGLLKTDLTAGDLGWGTEGNDHLFESVDFAGP
jgi:hypothetical protein